MPTSELEYTPLVDDPDYLLRLTNALTVEVMGVSCVIVEGFKSDAATVPAWAWSIIRLYPTHPKIVRGAVVHDLLYILVKAGLISRKLADKVFREITKQDGLGRFRRNVVYYAVRIRGGARAEGPLTPQEKEWVARCQLKLTGA